ncbi:MAG TPA: hypothetical protein VJ829_15890 [Candidatus Binatia bacterium]|nr:hypothetical protein [Candidatus Binatia bacterium]
MKRWTIRSRISGVALACMMLASVVLASAALADDADESRKITCADGQATMVESKTCPPTNRRPAVVVQRACCTKTSEKGTKTRCKSFPHCPRNSPS